MIRVQIVTAACAELSSHRDLKRLVEAIKHDSTERAGATQVIPHPDGKGVAYTFDSIDYIIVNEPAGESEIEQFLGHARRMVEQAKDKIAPGYRMGHQRYEGPRTQARMNALDRLLAIATQAHTVLKSAEDVGEFVTHDQEYRFRLELMDRLEAALLGKPWVGESVVDELKGDDEEEDPDWEY